MLDPLASWRMAKWSLRKLRLGIRRSDLVLDVGSGSNPHPRADVLLEKYMRTDHRYGTLAVADRPTVFADACAMPFGDKTFDFIIAFHVLEHMRDPAAFLSELMRVGRAGYIETPNVVFERLVPYPVHLLEIMAVEGQLRIRKKEGPVTDTFFRDLAIVAKDTGWKRFFFSHPDLFHVRYFWRDRINFEIENPEETCGWYKEEADGGDTEPASTASASGIRGTGLAVLRKWFAMTRPKMRLEDVLACPRCHGSLEHGTEWLACRRCRVHFPSRPFPDFNRAGATG
jgi:SAM-dependent methyltransferase